MTSVTSFESSPSADDASTIATTRTSTSLPPKNQIQSKLLDTNNKRCELLLGQVEVLESESKRKDEKLRTLNDQLHGIQRGLTQIDAERNALLQKVKQLEEEKGKLNQQLVMREGECLSLVKRCKSQEERMKESAILRRRNSDLEDEMKELKSEREDQEHLQKELEATKQELEECRQKLDHTKRDHDALANTLRSCLANIKKLTQEKEDWEDEKRRLINHAEVELEKERLQHMEKVNELKVSLQSRQDKVDKLEEFMKDKSMINLKLRKENAELNKWKTQTRVKLDECERQIAELAEENKEINVEMGKVTGSAYDWSAKLQKKEDMIISLETELTKFMTGAMTTSATLENLKEENEELEGRVKDLQSKLKSFDGWTQERDAMIEYLSVTQSQIQELMEEVVTLQLENDDLEEEKQELLQKVESGAGSNTGLKALENDTSEKEFAWHEMEKSLQSKIVSLETEITVLKEGGINKSKTLEDTIRSLEWTLASRTKENISLRAELEAAKETEADSANQIKSLESNLSALSSVSEEEIIVLREKTQELQETVLCAGKEKIELENRIAILESQAAANDEQLSDEKDSHKRETMKLKSKILSLESELDEKTQKLLAADATCTSLEEKLSSIQCQAREEESVTVTNLMIQNAELTKQNEELGQSLESSEAKISELESKLTNSDLLLSARKESETCLREDMELITQELEQCIANDKSLSLQVKNLAEERDQSKLEAETLRSRNGELTSQVEEKEAKLDASRKDVKEQNRVLSTLRAERSALEEELKQAKIVQERLEAQLATKGSALQESSKLGARHQEEIQSLKSQLQKAQTSLLLKDDEIRDLRLIEIKDFEEEVIGLKEKLREKENEINGLVSKLETISLGQLEREHEVSEEVSKLKATIATLKREQREKEAEWDVIEKDTQDLKTNSVTQKRRNQLLEKSVESLRREKELILASERSTMAEKKKVEAELQKEICLREAKAQELYDCKQTVDSLEKSLATMSAQKIELAAQLDERTRHLKEMAEANQSLQRAASMVVGPQIDVDKLREERDDFEEKLRREQTIREVLEAEVSTVHAQLASVRMKSKSHTKLKEENAELQAKVKRQEAYLKKKIQKEKVLRDRSTSLNMFKAPANVVSPTKQDQAVAASRKLTVDATLLPENLYPQIAIIADNEI